MRHPSQITVRGLDPRVQREIHQLARREGLSLSKAALRMLEKGAGLSSAPDTDRVGSSLDHLIGTWTRREADALLESIQSCEEVDEEVWG
jgi:hypothetical protein